MEQWPEKIRTNPARSGDGAKGSQHWHGGGGRTPAPNHLSTTMTSKFHMLLCL